MCSFKYNRPSFSFVHYNRMERRRWTSSFIFLQITEMLVIISIQKYDISPSCGRPRLGAETAECEAGGQRKWAPSRQPPIKIFHNSVNNIDNGDRHSVYPYIWPSPRSASRVFNQIEIWSKLQITFYKLSLESVDISQGVRERARVPQLVMLCRRWAHLQCFAGRTGRTHGTTAGYCVAGKRAQYLNIRPFLKQI